MRIDIFLAALILPLFLAACSTQQVYGVGQAWQREQCFKIVDAQERSCCLADANSPYEDYKRQAEDDR